MNSELTAMLGDNLVRVSVGEDVYTGSAGFITLKVIPKETVVSLKERVLAKIRERRLNSSNQGNTPLDEQNFSLSWDSTLPNSVPFSGVHGESRVQHESQVQQADLQGVLCDESILYDILMEQDSKKADARSKGHKDSTENPRHTPTVYLVRSKAILVKELNSVVQKTKLGGLLTSHQTYVCTQVNKRNNEFVLLCVCFTACSGLLHVFRSLFCFLFCFA